MISKRAKQLDRDLKLGADPEFLFLSRAGVVIHANGILSGYHSQFGVDGGGSAVEIRPTPSADPAVVVKNIQTAMRRGVSKLPKTLEYQWKAGGSTSSPIGGHIHFGTRALGIDFDSNHLASALDDYLSVPLLPVENKAEARWRRQKSGYGVLSDIRNQNHGFEYRTPGSWITSPKMALAVLSLAKVVAVEFLMFRLGEEEALNFSIQGFKNASLRPSITKKAWERIEKMALYPKYKRAINYIRELSAKHETWDAGDLKSAWSVLTPRMMARITRERVAARTQILELSKIWGSQRVSTGLYQIEIGGILNAHV